ncbi:hypothetical protein LCGC14_1124170 [marine sediment metagenome]|uniref:Uncharacterized protein n=1 Tax=marine sediment metagenome TaxID=412755 RepID=A0A0F9MR04_9ZZZZ
MTGFFMGDIETNYWLNKPYAISANQKAENAKIIPPKFSMIFFSNFANIIISLRNESKKTIALVDDNRQYFWIQILSLSIIVMNCNLDY